MSRRGGRRARSEAAAAGVGAGGSGGHGSSGLRAPGAFLRELESNRARREAEAVHGAERFLRDARLDMPVPGVPDVADTDPIMQALFRAQSTQPASESARLAEQERRAALQREIAARPLSELNAGLTEHVREHAEGLDAFLDTLEQRAAAANVDAGDLLHNPANGNSRSANGANGADGSDDHDDDDDHDAKHVLRSGEPTDEEVQRSLKEMQDMSLVPGGIERGLAAVMREFEKAYRAKHKAPLTSDMKRKIELMWNQSARIQSKVLPPSGQQFPMTPSRRFIEPRDPALKSLATPAPPRPITVSAFASAAGAGDSRSVPPPTPSAMPRFSEPHATPLPQPPPAPGAPPTPAPPRPPQTPTPGAPLRTGQVHPPSTPRAGADTQFAASSSSTANADSVGPETSGGEADRPRWGSRRFKPPAVPLFPATEQATGTGFSAADGSETARPHRDPGSNSTASGSVSSPKTSACGSVRVSPPKASASGSSVFGGAVFGTASRPQSAVTPKRSSLENARFEARHFVGGAPSTPGKGTATKAGAHREHGNAQQAAGGPLSERSLLRPDHLQQRTQDRLQEPKSPLAPPSSPVAPSPVPASSASQAPLAPERPERPERSDRQGHRDAELGDKDVRGATLFTVFSPSRRAQTPYRAAAAAAAAAADADADAETSGTQEADGFAAGDRDATTMAVGAALADDDVEDDGERAKPWEDPNTLKPVDVLMREIEAARQERRAAAQRAAERDRHLASMSRAVLGVDMPSVEEQNLAQVNALIAEFERIKNTASGPLSRPHMTDAVRRLASAASAASAVLHSLGDTRPTAATAATSGASASSSASMAVRASNNNNNNNNTNNARAHRRR